MNKPKAYQQGWIEFYKLRFKVTPDVLIPRPETELLVDGVLQFISQLPSTINHLPLTILDIGTGAGAIAISVAKNLPGYLTLTSGVRVLASDISEEALQVAKQNAKLHGVADKIEFIQSDLLSSLPSTINHPLSTFIIVTNLPYIPSARIPYLDSSVKDFEPWVALDGGKDGFELYRKLFQQIADLSTPHRVWQPRLIIGEIDYTHGDLAYMEAQKYFPEAEIEVKKDLANQQRILAIHQLFQ